MGEGVRSPTSWGPRPKPVATSELVFAPIQERADEKVNSRRAIAETDQSGRPGFWPSTGARIATCQGISVALCTSATSHLPIAAWGANWRVGAPQSGQLCPFALQGERFRVLSSLQARRSTSPNNQLSPNNPSNGQSPMIIGEPRSIYQHWSALTDVSRRFSALSGPARTRR
jgi:hypothetical protein